MTKQNIAIQEEHIDKSMFAFTQEHEHLHDKKLETKPIGYFRDAFRRFKKNKGSVVAAIIILLLVVFAVVVPWGSSWGMAFADTNYRNMRPKIPFMHGFWDGGYVMNKGDLGFEALLAIGAGAANGGFGGTYEDGLQNDYSAVMSEKVTVNEQGETMHKTRIDSYMEVGFKYMRVTQAQIDEIRALEKQYDMQIMYPMVDTAKYEQYDTQTDANVWYVIDERSSFALDEDGNFVKDSGKPFVANYLKDKNGNIVYQRKRDKTMFEIRVLQYNYFTAVNDGNKPCFIFGTNNYGRDILVRLAGGIRTSLILSICVSIINLIIGAIYGSVAGYYGGVTDLVMERITDILAGIPFMIVATLFQMHLVATGKVSSLVALLFAFVLTGWIGTAGTVRTQFYRFKNQEYVLAARTLGARDRRLIFKHIFPNTLGTLITSSVLVIPGVIFDESMLSYLGIIQLDSNSFSSLGSMLSDGNQFLSTFPHVILFPAIVISLLMICFNLFGNGLRDAFNPNLRGAED